MPDLMPLKPDHNGKYDIDPCRRVTVTCISEMGWFDDEKTIGQVRAAGGMETSQWKIKWDKDNAAGCCNLIEVEALDGRRCRFLMDTGWNPEYMDECFKRSGVDMMLEEGRIAFLYITHEHMDHLYGLETVLKYCPDIPILIPGTFYPEGIDFIEGKAHPGNPYARNPIPHQGEVCLMPPDQPTRLFDGAVSVTFDIPIIIRARGEQSLFLNIKDKGLVCITGCCHQSIIRLADYGRDKFADGDALYGIYGGLHISPFGSLDEEKMETIRKLAMYGFEKIACNHCTGLSAIEYMREIGLPIVPGTGQFGSKADIFVGNGDQVTF